MKIILGALVLVLTSLLVVSALSTSSSSYTTDVIVSSGGSNISSSNYATDVILGTITGNISSALFKNYQGFFFGAGAAVAAANNPPNNPSVSINSTDGSNYASQDLNCFAIITDNQSNNIDVTVRWYLRDTFNLSMDYNNSYSNGTLFNAVLDSGNTSVGDSWKCSMRLFDRSAYSDWVNSSSLTIASIPIIAAAEGGTGAGAAVSPLEISIEPQELNVDLTVNTNKEYIIKVTNTGTTSGVVRVSQKNLEKMVLIGENSFELKVGESKDLSVIFLALNETGIFTGKLVIGSKEVLVSIDIRTKLLLFDSNIVVLNENYTVEQGRKLKTKVSLIPMGDKDRLDVTLNYVIKDYEGKVYLTKNETLLIEGKVTINRDFETGLLPLGDYVIGLNLVYPGGVAPSSAHFKLIEKKPINWYLIALILAILIIILLIIIISKKRKQSKSRKAYYKRIVKPEEIE